MPGGKSMAERAERTKEMLDNSKVVSKARSFVSGDAQFFSSQPKLNEIRKELASESLSEKKEGMKKVIAQICKGNDMSGLFPDVVKNIMVNSIELRKLVYYFVVHYAEERPNESLLSISAFQKDLIDHSMHVRSLALRVLSSIRIPSLQAVVMVAIKKAASDMSPIVRKTAAISLSQVHQVSGGDESSELMVQLIHQFLGDKAPEVVGAAALSYALICPNQVELLHKHFRKICRSLVECDEWGQVMLLNILLRYARTQFTDPNKSPKKVKKVRPGHEDSSSEDSVSDDDITEAFRLDSDHRLLLQCARPLLLSLNRAVVVAAAAVYFHCAPDTEIDICAKPLIRLLSSPQDFAYAALGAIHTFVLRRPLPFIPHIKDFFINGDDSPQVRELKLRIISRLTNSSNINTVIHEFRAYMRSFDIKKVISAVQGLGMIASTNSDNATQILNLISPLLSHRNPDIVTEAVVVVRQLVVLGTDKDQTCRIVHKLMHNVLNEEITAPAAKASVLWLVGENIAMHVSLAKAAPDCFRIFAKSFVAQEPVVKKQIITLGLKLWLHLEGEGEVANRFRKIFFYVLELVRFDNDYEVRERGRIIECSLERSSTGFAVLKEATLTQKPLPQHNDPFTEKAKFQLGTISHLFGATYVGYLELPEWPEEQPNPTARDPIAEGESSEETDYSSSDESSGYGSSTSSAASSKSSSTKSSSSSKASSRSGSSKSKSKSGSEPASDKESSDEEEVKPMPPKPRIVTKIIAKPRVEHTDKLVAGMYGNSSFGSKPKHEDPTATPPSGKRTPEKPTEKEEEDAQPEEQEEKEKSGSPDEGEIENFVDLPCDEAGGFSLSYASCAGGIMLRVTNTSDSSVLSGFVLKDMSQKEDEDKALMEPLSDIAPGEGQTCSLLLDPMPAGVVAFTAAGGPFKIEF